MLFLKSKNPHKPPYVGLFFLFLSPHLHVTDGHEPISQVNAQEVTLSLPPFPSETIPELVLSLVKVQCNSTCPKSHTPELLLFRKPSSWPI